MLKYEEIFKNQEKYLRFGLEKESLRISKNGHSVDTKHPFKKKFENKFITVDFGEQQVELITGIHKSIQDCIDEIKLLNNIFYKNINDDEIIWNYSMPLQDIKKNYMALGQNRRTRYRKKLLKTSSLKQQLISGIHFNWSIAPEIAQKINSEKLNNIYFNIFKNYSYYFYLIKNMFGFSPTEDFKTFDKISYRQEGDDAYNQFNIKNIGNSYEEYRKNINNLIKNKQLIAWWNVYGQIRTKPHNAKNIKWIEVRNIDLDYLNDSGLNIEALTFINYFLLYLSQLKDPIFSKDDNLKNSWIILKDVKNWLDKYNVDTKFLNKYLSAFKQNHYVKRDKPNIKKIINQQIKLKNSYLENHFALKEIEDMELSTQILIEKSYIEGMNTKIINKKQNKIEIDGVLLKQATLNPFDSKKGLEIIDSKIKTNKFLLKNNFSSTKQKIYKNRISAQKDFKNWKNKKIVVKPVSTNFSKGITILNFKFNETEWNNAIEFAFKYDQEIIIELFVSGTEYRFLVINNKLVAVLKRIPANVKGDGKHNIKQLVNLKNQDINRGKNYKKPLEKIELGNIEKQFLKSQGLSEKYIPKNNEKNFLRHNSNISTGGDTVDVTNRVHKKYKEIAIEATKKLNLAICGLDIIIPNISKFGKYTILEMNWNPAIHMHTYPQVGKNRNPAKHILKLIKEKNKN